MIEGLNGLFDAGEGEGVWGRVARGRRRGGFRKARFQRDWRWRQPQWLNMGGGLGEGGEMRKSGPADLITNLGGLGVKIEPFFWVVFKRRLGIHKGTPKSTKIEPGAEKVSPGGRFFPFFPPSRTEVAFRTHAGSVLGGSDPQNVARSPY